MTGCERDGNACRSCGNAGAAGAAAIHLLISAGADAEPELWSRWSAPPALKQRRRSGQRSAAEKPGRSGHTRRQRSRASSSSRRTWCARRWTGWHGAEGELCGTIGIRRLFGENQPADRSGPGQLSPVFQVCLGHPGGCGPGGGGLCLLQNRCGGIYPPGHCELRRHRAHHWHRHWPGHPHQPDRGGDGAGCVRRHRQEQQYVRVDHGEAVILHRRQETAYFSNGKLTVAQIAADRITGAGNGT